MKTKIKDTLLYQIMVGAKEDGFATHWHLNENFIEWSLLYFQEKRAEKINLAKSKVVFSRFCKILIDRGFLESAVRVRAWLYE